MQPLDEQQAGVRTKSLSKSSNGVGTGALCGLNLDKQRGNSMTWICAGLVLIGDSDACSVIRALVRPVDGWGCFAPHAPLFATAAARGRGRKAGIHRIGASGRAIYSV